MNYRKLIKLFIMTLIIFGLVTAPVFASQITATKEAATNVQAKNEFYVGDEIAYTMTIVNPQANINTNTLTRIWDTLPNGEVIDFLEPGETLVQAPGDEATFYAHYTVAEADILDGSDNKKMVRNRFEAEGYDSAGDDVYAFVTKISDVLPFAELGDFVWEDLNRNGIQDANEMGMAGVTVNLYQADEDCLMDPEPMETTTTDDDGFYLFDGLRAGHYYVEFVLPSGYAFTMQYVGTDDTIDSNADTTSGLSDCLPLAAGDSHMTIDAGMYALFEVLDVSKTVETYYNRYHDWDIDKWVETDLGHTIGADEDPKIWLYEDGSGDEDATWYIDVTYIGERDDDFNVSGTVTIENTGDLDAVIEGVEDLLGGTEIAVDFGVTFPYALAVGNTLVGTYSERVADMEAKENVVTVTTERDVYTASADVIWGDPNEAFDATVNIQDISDSLGIGTQNFGPLTAPNGDTFSYRYRFAWADYENPDPASWAINNTATILETEQSASALLKINWLYEDLLVEKTAETSYNRTHSWDIDKTVETQNNHVIWEEEYPKIWLYGDGSGDEMATWNVYVDYLGYTDSDFNVSGEITITNNGTSAVVITGVQDLLCGNEITVTWPANFVPGDTLAVGESITLTYSEDFESMPEGEECTNDVIVTTEVGTYDDSVPVMWGDPTNEVYDVVHIVDNSEFLDSPALGTLDANKLTEERAHFTYDQPFAWVDYHAPGPYVFENIATIVETQQSASATLVVNWEEDEKCYADETAWAYGGTMAEPNWNFAQGENWGWTNELKAQTVTDAVYAGEGTATFTFDLYAGAGQNIIENGTPAGTISIVVTETDGKFCITVTYDTIAGIYLGETHLWVGNGPLPEDRRGRYSNAPGQFPDSSSFYFEGGDGETQWVSNTVCLDNEQDFWVAAHAVVWLPVECEYENGGY